MATKSIQREWTPPAGADQQAPGTLMLYNSLNDEKVPFVPTAGPGSKQITWYTCGPTVYDSAHMGHARNYVTFDIVRRVLEDYFGYNCLFVMNVTDVDDKIILRARRNYLLQQYVGSGKSVDEVRVLQHAHGPCMCHAGLWLCSLTCAILPIPACTRPSANQHLMQPTSLLSNIWPCDKQVLTTTTYANTMHAYHAPPWAKPAHSPRCHANLRGCAPIPPRCARLRWPLWPQPTPSRRRRWRRHGRRWQPRRRRVET